MKNVLRDWLGINEEKFALEVKLNKLQGELDRLEYSCEAVDDKVDSLENEVSDMKYEVEDKVTYGDVEDIVRDVAYYDIDDIKSDLDSNTDNSEIVDTVFDLVMQEIEHRDTIQELVEQKLEALTEEGRNNTGAYPDITEIVEDVVEELINKLRG
jgi:chromosome segregation ATPase